MQAQTTSREYRLHLTFGLWWHLYAPLLLLPPLMVLGFVVLLAMDWPWYFAVLPTLVWGAFCYFECATIPKLIVWRNDDTIKFVASMKRWVVSPGEITGIRPNGGMLGGLRIFLTRGHINLIPRFDDFHEFLTRLKAANPKIEMRGC